jgi:transposase InsO family protein
VAKKHGISEQTVYAWRKRFGALEAVDVKPAPQPRGRERPVEEAIGRAAARHRDLERGVAKKMVSARVRREQVAYVVGRGRSHRQACAFLSVARSSMTYRSRLVERDAPILAALRELAGQYPRYGYRRMQIFPARQGWTMSADRAHRLWRVAGLQVPRRRPRRRVASGRPRPVPATGPNQVWAYDFVFDACANEQTLKCLTVVDEYTREALAIRPRRTAEWPVCSSR